jgi:hypothetical protein
MSGDPQQCREYAAQCAEMASRATKPDHKQFLSNLAQTWLSLAVDLEGRHALVDAYPPPAEAPGVAVAGER